MTNQKYIYVMKGLNKSYNDRVILKDFYLSFYPGAKIGVIGHNGSGKSTLLRIMAGIDKEYNGEAFAAEGIKIGYLPQEPLLDESKDVFGNIMKGVKAKKQLLDRFNEVSLKFAEELSEEEMNKLLSEQAELQDKIDAQNLWDLEREVEIAMQVLKCPPGNADVSKISGGEKRRVAICKLLLEKPDMLLLDEPTNHLDAESVSWLENFLKKYSGTTVIITHDRYFLDNATSWILEIDRGEGIPWHGNYSSWLEQKTSKMQQEEKEESYRQKQLSNELQWIRKSAKGQQSKSKSRINAYNELRNQQRDIAVGSAKIIIPEGPRLGNIVVDFEEVSKKFDRNLINKLSFKVKPGAIVGVIGANGRGKTTLLKMITGQEKADTGKIEIGKTVKIGYVDQSRDHLRDNQTVWQEISNSLDEIKIGSTTVNSRAYCASFNFKGSDQQKNVGKLSGGERNRVHLAKMLKEDNNLIILDEPTNDLDVDTLRALEEALLDFSGCVIVVSHDRWFLDRIATHILAFEDNGIEFYEGNYSEYESFLRKKLGIGEDEPIAKYKHKKMV